MYTVEIQSYIEKKYGQPTSKQYIPSDIRKEIIEWGTALITPPMHQCQYCGAMTDQPDETCYKAPETFSEYKIAKKIFYSPATNGQAENSIKDGTKMISDYVRGLMSAQQEYEDGFIEWIFKKGIKRTTARPEVSFYLDDKSFTLEELREIYNEQTPLF